MAAQRRLAPSRYCPGIPTSCNLPPLGSRQKVRGGDIVRRRPVHSGRPRAAGSCCGTSRPPDQPALPPRPYRRHPAPPRVAALTQSVRAPGPDRRQIRQALALHDHLVRQPGKGIAPTASVPTSTVTSSKRSPLKVKGACFRLSSTMRTYVSPSLLRPE